MNLENKKIIELKDYEGEYLYDNRSDKFFQSLDEVKSCYEELDFEMPKYLYGSFFEPISLKFNIIVRLVEFHQPIWVIFLSIHRLYFNNINFI